MIWVGEAHNRDPELGNEHKSTEDEEDNEGNEDEAEEETSSSCTLLSVCCAQGRAFISNAV